MNRHIDINLSESEMARLIGDLNNEKVAFATIDGRNVRLRHFELPSPEEYEEPENFPKCCSFHKSVLKNGVKWFRKFPHCCAFHKDLEKKNWFNKSDFENLPHEIVTKLSYTEHFIQQNLGTNDWYELITEYLVFTIESFGRPSIGNHVYNSGLKHWIINSTPEVSFTKAKRNRLLEFIENYYLDVEDNMTDINILHGIVSKWVNSFPDFHFFRELKHFKSASHSLKLILTNPQYNRYLKQTTFRTRTKSELLNFLIVLSKKLLSNIDTKILLNNGIINDPGQLRLDIINEKHRIKQQGLLKTYSKKERRYIKIIKQWLTNEKEYLSEIAEYFADKKGAALSKSLDEIKSVTTSISIEIQNLSDELKKYGRLTERMTEKHITIYSQILANTDEIILNQFESDFKSLSLKEELFEVLRDMEKSITNSGTIDTLKKEIEESGSLTAKGKLKLVIPLLLFKYEMEIEAAEKVSLPKTWNDLKRVFIKE